MSIKPLKETIVAYGHENIQATHPTTIMITKDKQLSKTGDCIIAVSADKAPADFSPHFKRELKKENTKLTITIKADNLTEIIHAYGSPKLILTHPADIVIRKSDFTSDRTAATQADKSSAELSRELVEKLKNPKQKVTITFVID